LRNFLKVRVAVAISIASAVEIGFQQRRAWREFLEFADETLRFIRRQHDGFSTQAQYDGAMDVGGIGAVGAQRAVVIPAGEGKEAAIATGADAAAQDAGLILGGFQSLARQFSLPAEAVNEDGIRRDAVTAHGTERGSNEQRKRQQAKPKVEATEIAGGQRMPFMNGDAHT